MNEKNKRILIASLSLLFAILALLIFNIFNKEKRQSDSNQNVAIEKENISSRDKDEILKNDLINENGKVLIEKYAKDSQTLTIGQNCQMSPLVIKFKGDSTLTIENQDSKMHTIAFENQNFFTVSPQDKREINIKETFKLEEGMLHYRCSDVSQDNNVGVMYIVR